MINQVLKCLCASFKLEDVTQHPRNVDIDTEKFRNYIYNTTPPFSLEGITCIVRVLDVYDGDTMTVAIPLHDKIYRFSVRLNGIDTCEIKSKDMVNKAQAIRSRNRVLQLIGVKVSLEQELSRADIRDLLSREVYTVQLSCGGFEKYGRVMGDVYTHNSIMSVSDTLLKEQLAYTYTGGTKKTEEEQTVYFGQN
jgi:endonuclease YncB( thermonuclease family)